MSSHRGLRCSIHAQSARTNGTSPSIAFLDSRSMSRTGRRTTRASSSGLSMAPISVHRCLRRARTCKTRRLSHLYFSARKRVRSPRVWTVDRNMRTLWDHTGTPTEQKVKTVPKPSRIEATAASPTSFTGTPVFGKLYDHERALPQGRKGTETHVEV